MNLMKKKQSRQQITQAFLKKRRDSGNLMSQETK